MRLFPAAGGESFVTESSSNSNIVVFGEEHLSMSKSIPQNVKIYFKICLVDQTIDHTTISVLGFSCLIYAKYLDRNIQYMSSVTVNLISAGKKKV